MPNKPILDETFDTKNDSPRTIRYSLEKLKNHDIEWWQAIQNGLEYEILSHKMDLEDKEAAGIVAVALNKQNDTAMRTGHL